MPGKLMLKVICMCAVLSGAIAGFLPLIPKLTGAAFTLVMFFSAPFTIIYLHRLNFIKDFELPRCLTIGALSGFISFILYGNGRMKPTVRSNQFRRNRS